MSVGTPEFSGEPPAFNRRHEGTRISPAKCPREPSRVRESSRRATRTLNMKNPFLILTLLAVTWLPLGCATSTLESRKQERYGVYSGLTSEQRISVDLAQIKVGMPMDAVYIAWGKPDQILTAETSAGTQLRWLYAGTYLQGFTHWTYPGPYGPFHRAYSGPDLAHDYVVLSYIRAEVVFEGGVVREWRTLPRP